MTQSTTAPTLAELKAARDAASVAAWDAAHAYNAAAADADDAAWADYLLAADAHRDAWDAYRAADTAAEVSAWKAAFALAADIRAALDKE